MDRTPKALLHRYLRAASDALLWKLEGLDDYDVRRPLTPTGTNLLGIVKHLAMVESGYFGATFERPFQGDLPFDPDALGPNEDLFAKADESRGDILDLYASVRAHADATIEALDLDAEGRVPWWPDDVNPVTLHWILVHMTAETNRHAGHADILRESIDGAVGYREDAPNLDGDDADGWAIHFELVERAAREATGR